MIAPKQQEQLQAPELDNLQTLMQAFQNNCMPPAWLFVGPPGVGKSVFAYQLAQKILCASTSDEQNALIQHQMASGCYPNFFVLKKNLDDSELGIEDVRNLINYLRQSAPLSGWRVVIIEGVDTLNRFAANALLKTFEEPPAKTLILTTAVTASRVLSTLRSRCVRLAFSAPHRASETEDLLATLAQSRENGLEDLIGVGGLDFYESLGKAVGLAAKGEFRTLVPLIEKITQEDLTFAVAVELLEQFLYRLITYSVLHNSQQYTPREENIFKMLLQDIAVDHWLNVQQALSQFLHEARTTHLDKKHLLMACFVIVESPEGIYA